MEQFHTETMVETQESVGKHSGFMRFVLEVIETLALSIILFVAINAVSARIRIDGESMEPTLHSGEFVIVNKLSYFLDKPKTRDVIVFRFPRDPDQEYIKRVIGVPGDRVTVKDGVVYINDQPLEENYIASKPVYESTWDVPANSLFVLGDNRNNSSDSHNWGVVSMDYVIGKAIFVYWPPTDWGVVEYPSAVSAAP